MVTESRFGARLWCELCRSQWEMHEETHWNPTYLQNTLQRWMLANDLCFYQHVCPLNSFGKVSLRQVSSQNDQPCQSFGGEGICHEPSLWSVSFHFMEAFLHQKSCDVDLLGFNVSSCIFHWLQCSCCHTLAIKERFSDVLFKVPCSLRAFYWPTHPPLGHQVLIGCCSWSLWSEKLKHHWSFKPEWRQI